MIINKTKFLIPANNFLWIIGFEWRLLSKYRRLLRLIKRIDWSKRGSLSCSWSISILLGFHNVQIFIVIFKYYCTFHFFIINDTLIIFFIQTIFWFYFVIHNFSNIFLVVVFIFLIIMVIAFKRNRADLFIWVELTRILRVKMMIIFLMIEIGFFISLLPNLLVDILSIFGWI